MSKHNLRLMWPIVLVMSLFLAACNAPGTLSAATPPIDGSSTTPTVTLADDEHTITLHAGQSFLLKLGEGYDWTVTPADQTILSRVVNVLTIRGSQGLYKAHKPGQTTLTATGDPTCRTAQPPCGAPSREFRLAVIVE